jgi:hypothetical protein
MLASVALADDKPGSKPERHDKSVSGTAATVNGACVATAVGVREDALIAAHATFGTAINTALSTRKTELQASWNMTDAKARRESRTAAWKKFRDARRTANQTMKTAVKAAYSAFNTATKACGVQYAEQPEGGESVSL